MSETRSETLARFSNQCETCGRGPEKGLELRQLHVHHRNGDHSDDRPENRGVLCAMCHGIHHGTLRARSIVKPPPVLIQPKPRPVYDPADENLRALREAARLEAAAVARELGLSPDALCRFEGGYRRRKDADLPARYREAVRRLYQNAHAQVERLLAEAAR